MKKVLCYLLALFLACGFALLGVSWVGAQAVEPGLRDGGAVPGAEVQQREMQLIREKLEEMAPLYGFSAEAALQFVTPEVVADMNRQAARWWNTMLASGEAGEEPALDTEALAEVLLKAQDSAPEDSEEAGERAAEIAEAISGSVRKIILPLRLPIVNRGLAEAGKRVDLANVIRFLTGLYPAALALCALLAGLIALLESRRLRRCLIWIGAAAGAAVLVLAAGYAVCAASGLRQLIAEASPGLSAQFGALESGMLIRLAVYAAVLAAGCVLCLILCRRRHEAVTD